VREADSLERYGYDVLTAASGPAALDLFANDTARFDCVILDQSMPGLSGRDVLEALRGIRPEFEVLISSGYSEEKTMSLFAGVTVSGFL